MIKMHGMNPPAQYRSADGSWFVACNAPSGGRFQVFQESADGATVRELPETAGRVIGGQGQLCLQADGTLWASYGETAGTSSIGRFQIKEFIAPAAPAAPAQPATWPGLDLSGMWNTALTVAHEHDGLMYLRWNNLRDVLRKNARR